MSRLCGQKQQFEEGGGHGNGLTLTSRQTCVVVRSLVEVIKCLCNAERSRHDVVIHHAGVIHQLIDLGDWVSFKHIPWVVAPRDVMQKHLADVFGNAQ